MKAVLALVAVFAAGSTTTAFAEEYQWECTCTGACDDGELAVTVEVCADEGDVAEAVSDGAASCARELDGQCETVGACGCTCNTTGEEC